MVLNPPPAKSNVVEGGGVSGNKQILPCFQLGVDLKFSKRAF